MTQTFLVNGVQTLCDITRVMLISPTAKIPYKERATDVGYDIDLIGRVDNRPEDLQYEVNYFHTGLCITPPAGYHLEMVARSSLHKTGYMLATGTSIIDPEYTGEILVPLYKFKDTSDLELPFRAVQLVIRPTLHANFVPTKHLKETSRGSGGFGSTGNSSSSSNNFNNSNSFTGKPQRNGGLFTPTATSDAARDYPERPNARKGGNYMF